MPLKVMISGGGTGGHIFPAIAIANAVREKHADAEFLFVGAKGKMEMEKVPEAGYEIVGLNITGIKRSMSISNLWFPLRLVGSLFKARNLIKKFKPDVVVGVGGFASGPVLRMATWMGVPTLIQEQNSFAGITNRWVSSAVDKVCVAYDGMEKFFPKERIIKTGNPVRKSVVDINGKRERAINHFGLRSDKPVLLIVGGSLGSRSINRALHERIEDVLGAGIQVIWQTGKVFKQESKEVLGRTEGKDLHLTEFIFEMDLAYAAADIVVSRAGAIAVSELCLVAKPVILVPFPYAAEDHQTKNALALVNSNAALMVSDEEVEGRLVPEVLRLATDTALQRTLSVQIAQHALPNAANDIAGHIIKLAK